MYQSLLLHFAWISYYVLCSLQGGDEIDDIFGCSTVDGNSLDLDERIVFADTYNVAGGGRQNVGDNSGEVMYVFIFLQNNSNFNKPLYQWCNQGQACIGMCIALHASLICPMIEIEKISIYVTGPVKINHVSSNYTQLYFH